MKLSKNANGKTVLKISKAEWEKIGQDLGWKGKKWGLRRFNVYFDSNKQAIGYVGVNTNQRDMDTKTSRWDSEAIFDLPAENDASMPYHYILSKTPEQLKKIVGEWQLKEYPYTPRA